MRALALAAVAAFTLAACGDIAGLVTVNANAVQAKIEEMTGKTPEEQCALYLTAKAAALQLGRTDLVELADAKLAEAGIALCVPA